MQAEAVLKEVALVSNVASPQVMEALSVDCNRLREAILHTKYLIHLKREERDKGLLKVIKGWNLICLVAFSICSCLGIKHVRNSLSVDV